MRRSIDCVVSDVWRSSEQFDNSWRMRTGKKNHFDQLFVFDKIHRATQTAESVEHPI